MTVPVFSSLCGNEIAVWGFGKPTLIANITDWCRDNDVSVSVVAGPDTSAKKARDRVVFEKHEDASLAYLAVCGRDWVGF